MRSVPDSLNRGQLRLIVQALPQAALVLDETAAVLVSNADATALFETDPSGQHLTFVLRAPAVLGAVSEALAAGAPRRVQYATRTPVPRTLDVQVAPMGHDADTGHRLFLLTSHDLTYHEQIERMRADFVANASHELRTPLSSLTGFIETMQGAARDDAAARDNFLNLMKTQASRMARLIDDLLSLSRIEINEHVPPTDTVDLVSVARQAEALLTPTAAQASCSLQLDLPAALKVRGDAQQLLQVVLNLIENAIKYGSDGKLVEITGRVDQGAAILSVKDHGPGIAAHHVPRLTERFYRVSAQDSRKRGGTGLGLAIAKHIMNRHRGRLQIESELGRGSTFSIRLPTLN
jgi:two-component system phosphate regulon sensor histidine kinase PhoR